MCDCENRFNPSQVYIDDALKIVPVFIVIMVAMLVVFTIGFITVAMNV